MKKTIMYILFTTSVFGSSLNELVDYALKNSTIVRQTKANLELSKLKQKSSKLQQFGKIDAVGSFTHYNIERTLAPLTPASMKSGEYITTSKDIYSAGVNYTVPLFTGFAQTRDIQIQALAKEMAKAKLNLTKEELAYNIKSLYLSLLTLKDMLKAQDSYISALKRLKKEIEYKVTLGKKAEIDAIKAEADLEEAKANKESILANISITKATLSSLVGKKVKTIEPITFNVNKKYYSIDALFDKAVKTSKIKIEDLNLNKSDKMIQKSKSALYPQLSLNAYYGKNFADDMHTGEADSEKLYQVGVNAKYNLIDFGQSTTNIQQAKIAKLQAKLKREQSLLDLKKLIIKAVSNIKKSYAVYKGTKSRYYLSKKAEHIESIRYENDASTLNDLLLAKAKTLISKAKMIESRYNYKKSIYYLDYILERGTNHE